MTRLVVIVSLMAHPTMRRDQTSSAAARYSDPCRLGISLMSTTQIRLGASAVKSRATRSGAGRTDGSESLIVVGVNRFLGDNPTISAAYINRATRLRPTPDSPVGELGVNPWRPIGAK